MCPRPRPLHILIALVATTLSSTALQAQTAQTAQTADSVYRAEIVAIQRGDPSVDVTAIRRAYAATTVYNPYGGTASQHRSAMFAALQARNYALATAQADSLLAIYYLDPDAHFGRYLAARATGDSARATYHASVVQRIIASMQSTGDGRTPDRPLLVITPAEEFSYIGIIGLSYGGQQALVGCSAGACDQLAVTAPSDTTRPFPLYFDVTLPTTWLRQTLGAATPGMPQAGTTPPAASTGPARRRTP